MTRSEAVKKTEEYFRKRKLEINAETERRESEAVRKAPKLKELINERAALPIYALRLAMTSPEMAARAAEEMREKGLKLNALIRGALSSAGLPEDFLKPKYNCQYCKDTGYIDDGVPPTPCKCFNRKVNEYLNEDRADGLCAYTFDNYDESRIPNAAGEGGVSQRELTNKTRIFCERYADSYPNTSFPGIILDGQAGLGKTFLMSCMCRRMRDRGFEALIISSFELMERIRSEHFGQDGSENGFKDITEAPILFIDDFGNEPLIKGISAEYICVLLNERMNRGLHTVITTNLTPQLIKEKYNERVLSRLSDTKFWAHLRLVGDDIRRL